MISRFITHPLAPSLKLERGNCDLPKLIGNEELKEKQEKFSDY